MRRDSAVLMLDERVRVDREGTVKRVTRQAVEVMTVGGRVNV